MLIARIKKQWPRYIGILMCCVAFASLAMAKEVKPMVHTIELYVRDLCPYCERVELAFEVSEITYEKHIIKRGNQADWMQNTPAQTFPMVRIGEEILFESLVLLDFISELKAQQTATANQQLLPNDLIAKAKQKAWASWFGQFQNKLNMLLVAEHKFELAKGVASLEAELSKAEGMISDAGYFNSDHFAYCDIIMAPVFYRLSVLNQLSSLHLFADKPKVAFWYNTVLASPAVQRVYSSDWRQAYNNMLRQSPGLFADLVE